MSWARRQIAAAAGWSVWSAKVRARMLRAAGARIGRARVRPGIRFVGSASGLRIGDGSFINVELLVGSGAEVRLGTKVHVGPRCALLPGTHDLGPAFQRAGATRADAIFIGDGSWLGSGVTVLGGVSIGRGTVVAAGAVVTSDCEPNALYGGVPARKLRTLGTDGGDPGAGKGRTGSGGPAGREGGVNSL